MRAEFAKYEALGNDFVVLDARRENARLRACLTPACVRALCHRHFGVGADGVLLVEASADADVDAEMVVYNADGTLAERCGNGTRCVARYLMDRGEIAGPSIRLLSHGTLLVVRVVGDELEVDMGAPLDRGLVKIELASETVTGRFITVGNPHLVIFGSATQARMEAIGSDLSQAAEFPHGVNVSFAELAGPRRIKLRVWERGSGPTLACGTGACATVTAAWIDRRIAATDSALTIETQLPGGSLFFRRQGAVVYMRGAARETFGGHLCLERIAEMSEASGDRRVW